MAKYNAAGVTFKRASKVYDFLNNGLELAVGDLVVIESDKYYDMARVVVAPREIEVNDEQVMKSIIRKVNDEDMAKYKENTIGEKEAFKVCKDLAIQNNLDMKLLYTEYTLDKTKLTFYFVSEGRIDFRQLVRDLARVFKTRIEMRQIGIRDATKMTGGFGMCGRELCCTCFLRRFDNISIKMAKTQNLIFNPNKISGVCGRLMCCLMFEKDENSNCGGSCNGCNSENSDTEFIEFKDDDLNNIDK